MEPSANGDLVNRVQQLRLDDQLGAVKPGGGGARGGTLLPWVLCAMLAVTWAGVGVRSYKNAGKEAGPGGGGFGLPPGAPGGGGSSSGGGPAPAVQPSQPSGTSEPATAAGALVTQLKGIVIPSLQVTVSPRDVAAEIIAIDFYEGKRVKAGETLATLLDLQYKNRLKTDEAAVASALAQKTRAEAARAAADARVAKTESALASSRAKLTRALALQDRAAKDFAQAQQQRMTGVLGAQDFQRFEADKLGADADKIAAEADVMAMTREVEAAKADVNTAIAGAAAAAADVKAAEARCDESRRLVQNCTVLAPIDGTILTKTADKGALVSPMSFNVAAGICSIADLSKLEVEIDVPERQVMRIKPGQDCLLQADANPQRGYRGVVDRVMPIADDTKNVVKVRIRAYLPKDEEQGAFLKPKMSVTATVYEKPFVFTADKDFAWGDESTRGPAWAKVWDKK
jgi:HlyD family secretion protein